MKKKSEKQLFKVQMNYHKVCKNITSGFFGGGGGISLVFILKWKQAGNSKVYIFYG